MGLICLLSLCRRRHGRRRLVGWFAEHIEIQDLQDANRVYDEQDDKPWLTACARRLPQSEAFPDNRPNENKHKQGAHSRIELADAKCVTPHKYSKVKIEKLSDLYANPMLIL